MFSILKNHDFPNEKIMLFPTLIKNTDNQHNTNKRQYRTKNEPSRIINKNTNYETKYTSDTTTYTRVS